MLKPLVKPWKTCKDTCILMSVSLLKLTNLGIKLSKTSSWRKLQRQALTGLVKYLILSHNWWRRIKLILHLSLLNSLSNFWHAPWANIKSRDMKRALSWITQKKIEFRDWNRSRESMMHANCKRKHKCSWKSKKSKTKSSNFQWRQKRWHLWAMNHTNKKLRPPLDKEVPNTNTRQS